MVHGGVGHSAMRADLNTSNGGGSRQVANPSFLRPIALFMFSPIVSVSELLPALSGTLVRFVVVSQEKTLIRRCFAFLVPFLSNPRSCSLQKRGLLCDVHSCCVAMKRWVNQNPGNANCRTGIVMMYTRPLEAQLLCEPLPHSIQIESGQSSEVPEFFITRISRWVATEPCFEHGVVHVSDS